jgi:hypothetical protein
MVAETAADLILGKASTPQFDPRFEPEGTALNYRNKAVEETTIE